MLTIPDFELLVLTLGAVVCKELFQALEACHADRWRKWTGGCNNDKHELNMCLRKVVWPPFVLRHFLADMLGLAVGGFGAES